VAVSHTAPCKVQLDNQSVQSESLEGVEAIFAQVLGIQTVPVAVGESRVQYTLGVELELSSNSLHKAFF
jgi:hypothetical protein